VPTPTAGYRNKAGQKVPGTTTIIGRFKDSGALIYWAYNRGKEGLELYESRDKAAELGTIVHSMVEQYIAGSQVSDVVPICITEKDRFQLESAFNAFIEWFESNKFEIVEQEIQLVSEQYQFGGTPDAIAKDGKGRLVLLDWKTSDGVYADHLIQLGAYRLLWNETHPDNQLTGGSHLCRFAKTNGDFAHHFFPDLSDAERQFVLFREAYDLDKLLKKRT
jgi:hypothetical protein